MASILAVEDDPHALEALRAMLREHNHYVLTAGSGERALELACSRLPDVVVTDLDMPLMDGIALCQELKRYPGSAMIPIIMTSAKPRPSVRPTPWTMYFQKPVNPVVLEAAVESLVAKRYWRVPGLGSSPAPAPSRLAPIHKKEWV